MPPLAVSGAASARNCAPALTPSRVFSLALTRPSLAIMRTASAGSSDAASVRDPGVPMATRNGSTISVGGGPS